MSSTNQQIIIEDVSNPGRDDVVPTVAREEDEAVPTMSEEEDDEEMREEVEWNPFLYRRLQDLPVRT